MSSQTKSRVTAGIETIEICFNEFASLPAGKGIDYILSPEFSCLNHKWCLCVYPGGHCNSAKGDVAIFLRHLSDKRIDVQCTLVVKGSAYKSAVYHEMSSHSFQPPGDSKHRDNWGTPNFAKRTVLIEALQQGSLAIKVELRQPKSSSEIQPFVPKNPFVKNINKKFNHKNSADIVISCGRVGENEEPTKKFYAHRFVLEDGAPVLFDLSGLGDVGLTHIPITDVEPAIFERLLLYVYGGNVESGDLKDNAKAYIDAADKYNVVHLKLEAEATLVSSTEFTIDNVMDLLLYADNKNCALLKETAIKFLVKNRSEVQKKLSFDNVPGHLMMDLLAAIDVNDSISVSALRKRLHDMGLEVDGSREAMIARLEEVDVD